MTLIAPAFPTPCSGPAAAAARPVRIGFMATARAWAALTALVLASSPVRLAAGQVAPDGMVLIPAGTFSPTLRNKSDKSPVAVAAFLLDTFPVTNAGFLAFVRNHPAWRRSRASRLFVDGNYLSNWKGDLDLGPLAPPDAPVVNVSWFAAEACAEAAGKRLPSTAEWEYAFAAGYTNPDGRNDSAFQRDLYSWLALPTPAVLPSVSSARANTFGVRGMVGFVWEWVDDFNAALLANPDSAGDDSASNRVCGSAGFSNGDFTDYAAFMRIALRSSVKARDTVSSLGFRCARDLNP